MEMNNDVLYRQMVSDLAINARIVKGQDNPVNNCWHFFTDGNSVGEMFFDDEDFINGMNRIYVVIQKFNVVILSFCLMDTHIHFVLYGRFEMCNKFIHEYVRLTSMNISERYGFRNKMSAISIRHQAVDTDFYLRTVICYTLKNPVNAGLPFPILGYPWSSGPLYFSSPGYWMLPEARCPEFIGREKLHALLKTHIDVKERIKIVGALVHPSEYVSREIVEQIFRSAKSFNWFLCRTKEDDIDSRGGAISYLTLPMQEMRQNRNVICTEMFGSPNIRVLDTGQRIRLARMLKSRYNSSMKQIARLCGLRYDEVGGIL